MSKNQQYGLVMSILGFIILMVGSLGYMSVYTLDKNICYVLMGIGLVMVIVALAIISLMKDVQEYAAKEE